MHKQKHTWRLLIAVLAGIALAKLLGALTHEILFLTTNFPSPFKPMFKTQPLLIALTYHSIYAVISAMLTAKIARDQVNKAVLILGTKEAVLWLVGALLLWKHAAPWFNISKALLGIPLAWIGGRIYSYLHKRNEAKSPPRV